jgi:rhamnulose-1-phosphate aldolase
MKDKLQFPSLEKTVTEIAETAGYIWEKGWAERNAGNLSVNITGLVTSAELEIFTNSIIRPLSIIQSSLVGQVLMVTNAGSRMRDLVKNPWDYLCFLQVDVSGNRFRQWPDKGCAPTSELPTHLAVHNMLVQTNSTSTVLLHAHVTELIALTQIHKLCSTETLNRLLWSMHPETHLFVPQGLSFIPYDLPGTSDIAFASSLALQDHPLALWEKHGVLATGKSVSEAFDTIDLLSKAARIYFLVKSAGHEPEGLTDEQMKELTK